MLVSVNPNTVLLTNAKEEKQWILDSGATDHCTSMKTDFHLDTCKDVAPFHLCGICCDAIGKGNVTTRMKTTPVKIVIIQYVIYVPELQQKSNVPWCHLLSLSKLQDNSKTSLHFTPNGSCIHVNGKFFIPIVKPEPVLCSVQAH